MVPEGAHVRSVYLDPENGVCSTDISNKLVIDCSTIDTATSLTVKDYIAQNFPTASFYDSPVSGGVVGAVKGTIAFAWKLHGIVRVMMTLTAWPITSSFNQNHRYTQFFRTQPPSSSPSLYALSLSLLVSRNRSPNMILCLVALVAHLARHLALLSHVIEDFLGCLHGVNACRNAAVCAVSVSNDTPLEKMGLYVA